MNLKYIMTPINIVINYNGVNHTIVRKSDKGVFIEQALRDKREQDILNAISPLATLPEVIASLIGIDFGGKLFYIKDPNKVNLPKVLGDRIVSFAKEGLPFEPLINFWERCLANPNYKSIEGLYNFLESGHFPITPEGKFIAYKKVTRMPDGSLKDSHTRTIDNSIGSTPSMPREKVTFDPNITCASGLHVANFKYAKDFSGNVMVEVEVDPHDVVSVPTDYNYAKMRVCKYKVIGFAGTDAHKEQIVDVKTPIEKKSAEIKTAKQNIIEKKAQDITGFSGSQIKALVKTLGIGNLDNIDPKNKVKIVREAVKLFEANNMEVIADSKYLPTPTNVSVKKTVNTPSLSNDEIKKRVFNCVDRISGYAECKLKTNFDDLGFDSLDVVEFVMDLEKEFDISIPDSDVEKFTGKSTLKDIVDYLQRKL